MVESQDEGRDRPGWLAALHSLSLGELQRSHEIASRTNLHEDAMLIWVIALAGGAVYLAVQISGYSEPKLSIVHLFIGVLPWIVTIFTGVVARLLMPHLLLADSQLSHIRRSELALLPLRRELDDRQFGQEIVEMFGDPKEGVAAELAQKANRWSRKVDQWSMVSQVSLAAGILWFPGVLVFRHLCQRQ